MKEARKRSERTQDLYERLERESAEAKRRKREGEGGGGGSGSGGGAASGGGDAGEVEAWCDAAPVPITAVAAEYPGGVSASTIEATPGHAFAAEVGADEGSDAGGAAAPATSDGRGGAARGDGEAALPAGWVQGTDPTSGFAYFWHEPSGRTQWERPDA